MRFYYIFTRLRYGQQGEVMINYWVYYCTHCRDASKVEKLDSRSVFFNKQSRGIEKILHEK